MEKEITPWGYKATGPWNQYPCPAGWTGVHFVTVLHDMLLDDFIICTPPDGGPKVWYYVFRPTKGKPTFHRLTANRERGEP
jgi:hypothetical protein